MTKSVLKTKINHCIKNTNDEEILEAVYSILNNCVIDNDYELSVDDIDIIEKRRKFILNGEEKLYTVSEVKRKLLKNLSK